MQEWINNVLSSGQLSFGLLMAAFLFGIIGSVTSCCNYAAFGAVVSYSGSINTNKNGKFVFIASLFFLLGMIISFAIIGGLTGLVSRTIGALIGNYWKIIAGLLLIFFGLSSLKIMPIKLPSFNLKAKEGEKTLFSALVFGLAIGGISTGCNSFCNPVFPVILGAAFLKGSVVSGIMILMVFGAGFGLPFAVAMLGVGMGSKIFSTSVAGKYISYISGVLLIIIGFYLLLSL